MIIKLKIKTMKRLLFIAILASVISSSCSICYVCTHSDEKRDDKIIFAEGRPMQKKTLKNTARHLEMMNYSCTKITKNN